jgi:hypothetical protein
MEEKELTAAVPSLEKIQVKLTEVLLMQQDILPKIL